MSDKVLGVVIQFMATTIIISVILLLVGVIVTVLIHVVTARAFRRGVSAASMGERDSNGGNRMSIDDLEKLPCFEFKAGDKGSGTVDCAVCLESLKMGDKCRLLPICNHKFHAQCIDSWLLKTPICPICRTSADSRERTVVLIDENSHSSEVAIELREISHSLSLQAVSASPLAVSVFNV